jgi:hypothetical protein
MLEQEFSLLSTMFRPALRPTQSTIKWLPVAISSEAERLKGEANHVLHVVPRLVICGTIEPVINIHKSNKKYKYIFH